MFCTYRRIIPNPNISQLSFSEQCSWCRTGTPSPLKLIFPAWAALNRAAANANGATLYWFLFNDFVTPLTVLYKSSVGWFVQGPLLDKLVWLQHSEQPPLPVTLPFMLSLSLSLYVTHSAHSNGFLSFDGVEGRKQVDWLMVRLINGDTSTRWRLVHRQLTAALPRWQKPHYSSNIGQKKKACWGATAGQREHLARLSWCKNYDGHSRSHQQYTHNDYSLMLQ